MPDLKHTSRPISKLKPHPRNPRQHDDAQIKLVAASIKEFGFTAPIIVDEHDTILAGHGRVMAAERVGLKNVPAVVLSGLTKKQKRAYVIADNKLAEIASWNNELLALELAALEEGNYDLNLIGFHDAEIAHLLKGGTEGIDIDAEWAGMPEYGQQDKTAFRSLVVHFNDQKAVDQFAKKLGKTFTETTKMFWYPEIEIERQVDKVYVTDES